MARHSEKSEPVQSFKELLAEETRFILKYGTQRDHCCGSLKYERDGKLWCIKASCPNSFWSQDQKPTPMERVRQLETAIRKHRDQRGDDRCWVDDVELYAILGDEQAVFTLPPREEFLGNCARFYECRQRHPDPVVAIAEYKGSVTPEG